MYETCGYANAFSNSKYLKAAQQLLDEVVNVRKALKQLQSNKCFDDTKENDRQPSNQSIPPTSNGISSGTNESIANSFSDLFSTERQNLQNNKIKLLSILDEVANWFINARVRLWKPMVEEIYKEEFADSEANSKSSLDDATKVLGENHLVSENGLDELQDSMMSATADSIPQGQVHDLKFDGIPDIEMNKPVAKTVQNNSLGDVANCRIMKLQSNQISNVDEQSPYVDKNIPGNQHGDESLMPAALSYDITELSGFAIGSQVSLALGLQHHERDAFPMSGGNQIRDFQLSYHNFNESQRELTVFKRLKQGDIVALIRDAGMPGISDPGAELVKLRVNENIPVIPIPGPSALVAALSVSGFLYRYLMPDILIVMHVHASLNRH
ncbi:hypothetical protein GH714_006170 [Hevea brasiliensis]|uniref:POX domain-containing protein n=1 Tax=Hevea brasiliensis TaxID=3981 RepID=A0A6A6M8E4_HEVBR|nr:hypothetical protein GH714_006170 [Hevea brasiliensis]